MNYILNPETRGETHDLEEFSPLLRELLMNRGIVSKEQAQNFLEPHYENGSHDPYLLKDMAKAVARIIEAIKKNERVVVWSDYDADGIPGAVIFHDFFKKIGFLNFINHIPDRHFDGFGLNKEGIEELARDGAGLIITIDCGISDIEEVEYTNSLGVDVIITDHHVPSRTLPSAYAIINPKQAECGYPEKMLCGAGVAFKLIQALLKKEQFAVKEGWEKWLLDMVGIATLSDMVPLLGENRILAYYGLKVLRKSPRKGLTKLLSSLQMERTHLSSDDVGFSITPRINAASRMGKSWDAFKLFATEEESEAEELVSKLNALNNERKGVVAALVKEIRQRLKNKDEEREIIILGNPLWRPSLLGLAANTLTFEYNCPVFLWGRDGSNVLKGSCRSSGVSLLSIMENVSPGVISSFGGHHQSGGFEVEFQKVHFLEEELSKAYKKINLAKSDQRPIVIEKKLLLDETNEKLWGMVNMLEPFGMGNPKPNFLFESIEIQEVAQFGKSKDHLKLIFRKGGSGFISAVAFYAKPDSYAVPLKKGERVNLIATLERSIFRSTSEIRLRIVNIF